MNIGKRIKERRKELQMSADELAKRLGKNRATVYRYENGEIENMPLDILAPIAKALNTTPAYIMGWDKEMQKKNDTLSSIVVKLRKDEEMLSFVDSLCSLDSEKLKAVKVVVLALMK